MPRLFLSVLLLFCSILCQAQRYGYKPATVITDSGTLRGFLRFFGDGSTPQTFLFATEKNGATRKLSTAEVKRVVLEDGGVYERRHIRVPVMNVGELSRYKHMYKEENYFEGDAMVQVLVSGQLSLYEFIDRYEDVHYFMSEAQDSALFNLFYEPFVDESGQVQGTNSFRNPLQRVAATSGCGETLQDDIDRVRYEAKSLIKLFRKLNACGGNRPVGSR